MNELVSSGLEGIVAAQTRLSRVEGELGELTIAGFRADDLAPHATFEETLFLLWNDRLPDHDELASLRADLAARRELPAATLELLRAACAAGIAPMLALRMAAATLDLDLGAADEREQALRILARFPIIVAACARLRRGEEPLESSPELSHAANFLYVLEGAQPDESRTRALSTYLNTIVDHGMNASTFTARVIASTEADLTSAITGAVGALSGPLHGGAPGPVLDMLDEISRSGDVDGWLRSRMAAGERLMGFGHRIYKVRDPRADVLAAASEELHRFSGNREFYRFALHVEARAIAILEELKPGRRLQTNVEFYTALLLHGIALPRELFSPLFAVGRAGGWLAHLFEQRSNNRLVRPQSEYVGAQGRKWRETEGS